MCVYQHWVLLLLFVLGYLVILVGLGGGGSCGKVFDKCKTNG